jgi:hypothetical protein
MQLQSCACSNLQLLLQVVDVQIARLKLKGERFEEGETSTLRSYLVIWHAQGSQPLKPWPTSEASKVQ